MSVRSRTDSTLLPLARLPLFWASLAFSSGIYISSIAWRPPTWWLLAAGFALSAAMAVRVRWLSSVLIFGGYIALGALCLQVTPQKAAAVPAPVLPLLIDSDDTVQVTGHVLQDGETRPGMDAGRQRVDIETESLTFHNEKVPVHTALRVNFFTKHPRTDEDVASPSDQVPLTFLYGDRIQFTARLREPRNFRNPGAFDDRQYLARNGISWLASSDMATVMQLPGRGGSWWGGQRARIRRSLIAQIHRLWPEHEAALMQAMLLGDRHEIDRDTTRDYQRTGAYHILVVAGLKVGILAFALLWLFHMLRLPQTLASLLTISSCAGYAYLTDGNAPVVRATVMLCLYLVARWFYRGSAQLNAIGAAALGMLAFDPRALFDAGFQMTYLAVLAIAGMALPWIEVTSRPIRTALQNLDSVEYDVVLAPRQAQWRLDLRLIAHRLARVLRDRLSIAWALNLIRRCLMLGLAVYDTLLISIFLQIALALPMAYYFHRAVMVGVPANALVVPLHAWLLPMAMLAVAVSYLWLVAARALASFATVALHATNHTVTFFSGMRLSDLRTATPNAVLLWTSLAVLLLSLVLIYRVRFSRLLAALGVVIVFVCALYISLVPPTPLVRPGVLEVTAIDVGQGDSILLVTPQGKTLLIDAGGASPFSHTGFDTGEDVVAPYLWSRGFTHLDAIALTHAHSDHIGGLPAILADFHPQELWVGADPPTHAYTALLQQAESAGMKVSHFAGGDEFDFGGAHLRVLAPPRDWVLKETPRNDDSLVLLVSFQETRALLQGDAEKRIERILIDEQPAAQLLKVAHHGSNSSTSEALLEAVHPEFAVISAGYRNPYGHPRSEVLERLQEQHIWTYRTDNMGLTTFYLDGKTVRPAD